MSSALSTSDVQAVKPVIETAASVEQTSSENTNQTDSLNTDTNSTTQHEISPLKRGHSDVAGDSENQTPAKSAAKKTRIERFKEESEALLKAYGLKEGTDSEKRLTRSRTRGTPATTPVSKPEPKKATTGAKRGRKPASEKEESPAIKATPQKKVGRGGRNARKQQDDTDEEQFDAVENSETTEQLPETESKPMEVDTPKTESVSEDDKKDAEKPEEKNIKISKDVKEKSTTSVPTVVVTKETTKEPAVTEEAKPVTKETKLESLPTAPVEKEENKSAVVEQSVTEQNSTLDSKTANEKNSVTNDTKVENNVTNNQTNEHAKKVVPIVETPTKIVEEKVVPNDTKLSESAVVEKQEVKSA